MRRNGAIAPESPGNCIASRSMALLHFLSHGGSSWGWTWSQLCSRWRRLRSFLSCAPDVSLGHDMKLSKSPLRASFLHSSSSLHRNTASLASFEMHAANSGCFLMRIAISSSRRKPHMASKGVRATASSGLWLSST